MKLNLRAVWQSRAPRERLVLGALAAVLLVILSVWLVQSGWPALAQLRAGVTSLRSEAARLELQAAELERLRALPAQSREPVSLRALVQDRLGAAGLAHALVRAEEPVADQVVLVFGAVSFADWLAWLRAMQAQRVVLASCRIVALPTPGMVSITATLVRPQQR